MQLFSGVGRKNATWKFVSKEHATLDECKVTVAITMYIDGYRSFNIYILLADIY